MMEPMTPDVGGQPLPSAAYGEFFHVAPVAMLVLRAHDLVMLEPNQPYLDAVGMAREDIVGRHVFDVFPNSPTNAGTDQETDLRSLMMAAVTKRAPVTVRGFRYDIPSGDSFDVRWWNVVETPVLEGDEVAYLLHYTEDVTDLHRARAQLTAAQAAQEVSATQLARLAEVALSLTGAETVEDLERIVVTGGLTVLGADGGGIITPSAGEWRVTASESLGAEARTTYAVQHHDSPLPGPVSARTGAMVLLRNRDDCVAFHPDMARVVEDTGRVAWACLPLTVQDRTLGSLTVGWRDEQVFSPEIVELMEGFAAQCATTLDRLEKAGELRRSSRRFQELAESLQSAMLTEPAAGGGLEVTVRYRSADDVAQVGGDWYDAFLQPDGATMLAIGDVSGHDEVAAAKMGQIRGLMRALAYDAEDRPHGDSPAMVLTRLEYVAQGLAVSELSTAILARIEEATDAPGRVLRWSNAGNAPPVVLLADGSTLLLDDKSDLLLGVDPTFPRQDHEITMPPGSTLLLYTDGLIERRGTPIDVGIEDLRGALSALAGAPLGALCDNVLETLAPHTGEDDIALIAVRV